MKALILAGGKGTRLRPYTTVLPKPMLPVGDFPILEIILRQLKFSGVEEVILAVGHMAQIFEAFFQDGRRLGMKISYSFEDKPLGTAGPIASVIDRLGQNFIVMNGDLLTTLNYRKMFEHHLANSSAGTIATYRREVQMDFGIIESNEAGKLERYIEKPTYHYDFGMGVNMLNTSIASRYLKPGEHLDLPDLMLQLKNGGHSVHCYREKCFWLDMGRPDDYQKATEAFEARRTDFLPPGA